MAGSHFAWDDIRAFVAVAELGTLSAAARELGVTHATIARRLADLERAFGGAPLFERSRLGYALTPNGSAALVHAREMAAAAEGFALEVSNADELAGSVAISATATLADWKIAPAIAQVAAAHPRLTIDLIAENRNVSLALREADVAVRLGRPSSGDALARKIGMVSYRLFGTRDYVRLTEPQERLVFTFSEPISREAVPRVLAGLVRGREGHLALPSFASQARAALAGTGLALLPDFLSPQFPDLEQVDDPDIGWDQEVWLLTHQDARRFRRVQLVASAIADAFRS